MTHELKALLAIFSDDELLWFHARLNDKGLPPERQVAHYPLIEAITNELIERGGAQQKRMEKIRKKIARRSWQGTPPTVRGV